jgi:hypothetical protein
MSDTQAYEAYEVGQKVTILDVNKVGEVLSVTDGAYEVQYTDDGGNVQKETCTADKLAPVEGDEKSDESEKDAE